eukprot:613167-Rhodomonas_salina.3
MSGTDLVSSYEFTTRCPVLTEARLLPGCRGSTVLATWTARHWGASWLVRALISLRAPYAMPGTDLAYDAISVQPCYAMSGTDLAMGILAYALAIPGTNKEYYRGMSPRAPYAMPSTDLAYAPHISLRVPYTMSETDLVSGAFSLRAC